jgi:hypothetical protein
MKSTRIFIKYLRKFLAGFISITPFVKTNSNQYPFNKENKAIGYDWEVIGEDLNLAIKKYNNKHNERK